MPNAFEILPDGSVAMTCFDKYGNPKPDKVYFDLSDLELVKQYRWCTMQPQTSKTLYAATMIKTYGKRTLFSLHQLLLPVPKPLSVDHIDRDGLNNRRSNLRRATSQEQKINQGMRDDNSSGVKGVCWFKKTAKWVAYVHVNRKQIHLGSFDTLQAATQARLEAEQKYFGPNVNLPV